MVKKLCLAAASLIFLLPVSLCAQEEQLTITSYYPSPYGVYQQVKFFPSQLAAEECSAANEGATFYSDTDSRLMACRNRAGSFVWEAVSYSVVDSAIQKESTGLSWDANKRVNLPLNTINLDEGATLIANSWILAERADDSVEGWLRSDILLDGVACTRNQDWRKGEENKDKNYLYVSTTCVRALQAGSHTLQAAAEYDTKEDSDPAYTINELGISYTLVK